MSIKRIERGYVPLISLKWKNGGREEFQTERTKIKEKTKVIANGDPSKELTIKKLRERLKPAK